MRQRPGKRGFSRRGEMEAERFQRRALQAGLVVEQAVVELAGDLLQRRVERAQVLDPAHRRPGGAAHGRLDPERVAVQAGVGAARRAAVGQAVGGVEGGGLGDLEDGVGHHWSRGWSGGPGSGDAQVFVGLQA